MTTSTASAQAPSDADLTLFTIGDLASRTGLTPEQVRTWEQRFGFPEPVRLESGHRRYTQADLDAVTLVVQQRAQGMRLEHAIAAARRGPAVEATGSVYAALSARHPSLASYTLSKRTLIALSWAIEDECLALANRAFLVGAFQRGRFFGQSAARWTELARTARASLVMADFADHDDQARPPRVRLPDDSPLLREWIIACDGPAMTAALVAWELPSPDGQGDRLFESIWTVDAHVVRDCVALTAGAAAAHGSTAAADFVRELQDAPTPRPPTQQAATAVFNRMVAYSDGTVLRGRRSI